MNALLAALTSFLLPLTFGHLVWVAIVIIAAIVVARLAIGLVCLAVPFLLALIGGIIAGLVVLIASTFTKKKKRHIRR